MRALIFASVLAFISPCLAQPGIDPICGSVPWWQVVLFPYPGDCTRYYECDHGVRTPMNCPAGLWFDYILQDCELPEVSRCRTLVCPPGIVTYYPDPYDCTQYYECYRGSLEIRTCPAGLYYNPFESRCTSPELSQCGSYGTTQQPTYPTPPSECWGVLPGETVLRPYPGDCTRFIECYGDNLSYGTCPPGFFFNADRQMCDIPVLSGCTDTPPVTPPEGFDDPRCANGNNDYWPDVECSRFIECWEGHGYAFDCPSGLYFDSISKVCTDPSRSDCGSTPTPPPPTRPPDWQPDPDCPWPDYNRYLYPYPGDCTKFLECYYGEKSVEDCPAGLWFNPTLLVCDYPYHAGCYYREFNEEL